MSQIKLSEIRAWSEMAAKREWDTERISYLLDLVERMGKALGQIRDVTAHTYDCPESLNEARVLRYISTATKPCSELCQKARALLKELKQ